MNSPATGRRAGSQPWNAQPCEGIFLEMEDSSLPSPFLALQAQDMTEPRAWPQPQVKTGQDRFNSDGHARDGFKQAGRLSARLVRGCASILAAAWRIFNASPWIVGFKLNLSSTSVPACCAPNTHPARIPAKSKMIRLSPRAGRHGRLFSVPRKPPDQNHIGSRLIRQVSLPTRDRTP
jgi:hypothetical protein